MIKAPSGKGHHPNSRKNLELGKFKPGQPPPPTSGRPKGSISLRERMDRYIHLPTKVVMPDGTITDKEVMDSIVLAMMSKARKGDVPAAKEILDRYYGKEAQPVELTGKDGEALQVNHIAHLEQLYGGMKDAFEVKEIEEK